MHLWLVWMKMWCPQMVVFLSASRLPTFRMLMDGSMANGECCCWQCNTSSYFDIVFCSKLESRFLGKYGRFCTREERHAVICCLLLELWTLALIKKKILQAHTYFTAVTKMWWPTSSHSSSNLKWTFWPIDMLPEKLCVREHLSKRNKQDSLKDFILTSSSMSNGRFATDCVTFTE